MSHDFSLAIRVWKCLRTSLHLKPDTNEQKHLFIHAHEPCHNFSLFYRFIPLVSYCVNVQWEPFYLTSFIIYSLRIILKLTFLRWTQNCSFAYSGSEWLSLLVPSTLIEWTKRSLNIIQNIFLSVTHKKVSHRVTILQ